MKKEALQRNRYLYGIILWLVAANVFYRTHDIIGWIFTLSFFLFIPGLLLLIFLGYGKLNKFQVGVFAFGTSLLTFMLCGLVLNQATIFGVQRPLSTVNIFFVLDFVCLLLLALTNKRLHSENKLLSLPNMSVEAWIVVFVSILMPILAIFGAFRLDNNAGGGLTLLLFALIPCLFLWLILRPKLESIHLVVVVAAALSILLSISMRGLHLTGHDVQTEYYLFQLTSHYQHWNIASFRDPYNACLSITIFPTMLDKITSIPPLYIYKFLFQIFFAGSLIPIYLFVKCVTSRSIALICSLVFISFPVFLNEMPMLNRQEIAFVFFALFLLAEFTTSLSQKERNKLSLIMLLGIILSHYSSTYVALGLFVIAKLIHLLLKRIEKNKHSDSKLVHPFILGWRLLLVTLLTTFLWNMQITGTGMSLVSTLTSTLKTSLDHSGAQASDVSYSLFNTSQPPPQKLLDNFAIASDKQSTDDVQYVGSQTLPLTKIGSFLSRHGIDAKSLNAASKKACAVILQLLLLVGVFILGYRLRKGSTLHTRYIFCLSAAAIVLLGLQTILPQLSVDYGTQRLFQQLLFIISIPIVIAVVSLLSFMGHKTYRVAGVLFVLLSILLTNFVGQILGGYPQVLPFNNSGDDFGSYYVHSSELDSAQWLLQNRDTKDAVDMDRYAKLRFASAINSGQLKPGSIVGYNPRAYVYEDYLNEHTGIYQIVDNGTRLDYVLTVNLNDSKNLLYNNGSSEILR